MTEDARSGLEVVDGGLQVVSCVLCGEDPPMIMRSVQDAVSAHRGLCEACAVRAYWEWKKYPVDAAPGTVPEVARTLVLVTRLARLPGGELVDPSVPESYEVALVPGDDGKLDLPSASVAGDPVGAALSAVCMATWPVCAETLFTGYTPRGRLVRVCTVTAWTDVGGADPAGREKLGRGPAWLPWSRWEADWGAMAGFYAAVRSSWVFRIWKYIAEGRKTSAPTVRLRRAAAEYLYLASYQKKGDPGVDTSMMPVLRQQLDDDERTMVRAIAAAEARQAEVVDQSAEDADWAAEDEEQGDRGVDGEDLSCDVDPLAGDDGGG